MRGLLGLYRLTVGKKFVMAVTGLIWFGFVIGHLYGNLKIFLGPEVFNHYGEFLRVMGAPLFATGHLLWLFRIAILAALLTHIWSYYQLWQLSTQARQTSYEKKEMISFSAASHSMLWGGIWLLGFILFHLAHLTWGWIQPDAFTHGDPYGNVIAAFSSWPLSLLYIVSMIPLGLHLYHGLWSTTQTLGVSNPKIKQYRRTIALVIAWAIVAGYVSIPLAVMLGLLS